MAQHGPPSGRPSRRAGSGEDERSERVRPDRARLDRPRRAERAEGTNWRQLDEAFRPGADDDLPPWAGPVAYPARAATAQRRPARPRLSDPYGVDESGTYGDDYQGDGGYRGRRRGADADVDADAVSQPLAAVAVGGPAGPDAGQPARRIGRRGRAAATRLRKSRRRVVRWCAVAIVACVIAAGITVLVTHHPAVRAAYVTSLQPGEYTAVPDACSSVTGATLSQYLPGSGVIKTEEQSGSTDSQCSFSVDHKPLFLVLEVTGQQYEPLAAASGDGSASQNAQDNFALAQQGLAHPVLHSPLSAAAMAPLAKVGQQAVVAYQHEHVRGITTELVTVLIRERNVVITVSLSGQESGHGYGPVPLATLAAGATAAAKDLLAKLSTERAT